MPAPLEGRQYERKQKTYLCSWTRCCSGSQYFRGGGSNDNLLKVQAAEEQEVEGKEQPCEEAGLEEALLLPESEVSKEVWQQPKEHDAEESQQQEENLMEESQGLAEGMEEKDEQTLPDEVIPEEVLKDEEVISEELQSLPEDTEVAPLLETEEAIAIDERNYNTAYVDLTEKNFPDEKFRNYLKEVYDLDGDGKFQPGIIEELDISSKQITDVTGLSYFTYLSVLNCNDNQLTRLDISGNQGLTSLSCCNNSILQFDLSNNDSLEFINIGYQYLELTVIKAADGTYTATSDILRPAMKLFEKIEDQGIASIIYGAEKMESGFRWNVDPMKGRYSIEENFGQTFVANEEYFGERHYTISLKFLNGYEVFDTAQVLIDEEHFPDKVFREWIRRQYDSDNDGKFQPGLISELNISSLPQLKDLSGLEYFKTLSILILNDNPALKEIDLSNNHALLKLEMHQVPIHCLDLRGNPNIQELLVGTIPITSLYLAEGAKEMSWLNTAELTATAVEENGRYVLDMSQYGGLDKNRIVEFSGGKVEGNKVYWNSAEEVPTSFYYKFLMRGDYKEGMAYSNNDVLMINFLLTNNMPQEKILALTKENFPSEQLLEYLKQNYDSDGDGQINTKEVNDIYLVGQDITTLEGIEHLNYLQSLTAGSSLEKLDLSSNVLLRYLAVSGSFTEIILTGCSALESVDLRGNSLIRLDVSQNKMLQSLDVGNNSLTHLDISQNQKLETLRIDGNAISSLDLSKNNKLKYFDCSQNSRLSNIIWPVQKSEIRELNINNTKLKSVPLKEMVNLEVLSADSNEGNLKSLDLTCNTKLRALWSTNLSLIADWSKMADLETLSISSDDLMLEKLDLSKTAELRSCSIEVKSLKELDVSGCVKLWELSVRDSQLQKMNLLGCRALESVNCSGNNLVSINVKDCKSLKNMDCSINKLGDLDVSGNLALQNLRCHANNLKTVDVSKNLALKWFDCSMNPIVSLELSNNKAMLSDLNCESASLTSLDLGMNQALENVQLDNQVIEMSAEVLAGKSAAGISTIEEDSQTGYEISAAGAGNTGKYILRLDKYGSFDPKKVKNLSSGTVTANGIVWDSKDQVPKQLTYEYSISNNYKLSGQTMPVKIILSNGSAGTNSQKKLSACKITLKTTSVTYTGKAQKPTVTVKDGSRTLKAGSDYTIAYQNNKNAGKAAIVLTGKGNYTGSVKKYFTIQKASQKLTSAKSYQKVYGSKPFSLKVTRKTGNGKLSYSSSNKKVATVTNSGKVTLKGTGIVTITVKVSDTANYKGTSLKITITVNPAKQAIKALKTLKGQKLSVSWKKDAKAAGYHIQCSTDQNFKKGVKTTKVTKASTTSATIKGLKAGQKYYVRVRSYKTVKSGGKNKTLYGSFSTAKTVTFSPAKQTIKSIKTVKGKKLSVSWKKDTKASGYQIQYSTDKNFKKGVKVTKIKKGTTASATLKGLKEGKKYYVRVRAYKTVKSGSKSKVLYGEWSSKKQSGKIKK